MQEVIHHIPILTTVISVFFAIALFRHWRSRPAALHVFWWCLGVAMYGAGTLTESLTTLLGWHPVLFKSWYVSGALLGGAPLAQGTVYLLMRRITAHRMTYGLVGMIAVAAVCVILSPIDQTAVEANRLSGTALSWQWTRVFSPFINLYAFIFLVGGAAWSAWRYYRRREMRHRYYGNVAIALGALLPGIGGAFTRFGHTEVLYVTELAGILLIWFGYHIIRSNELKMGTMRRAAAPIDGNRKLLMVYNADQALFSSLTDFAHKIISPDTYQCNLCKLTYGNVSMHREWKHFLASLDRDIEFLHRDELVHRYPDFNTPLPAILQLHNGSPRVLVDADRINAAGSLAELKDVLASSL